MSELELFESTHKERETFFAEVILPLPLRGTFTYRVPHIMSKELSPGQRVVVQFGRKKILTGIIESIHTTPPSAYEAKTILDSLDDHSIVTDIQLRFFKWIASYYMASLGDVLNAGIPSGFRLSSESYIQLNPNFDLDEHEDLTEREEMVINQLISNQQLSYERLSELLGIKSIAPIIKSLLKKEAILLFEELKEKFKPKYVKRVRLNQYIATSEGALEEIVNDLDSKPKQQNVILKYLQKIPLQKLAEMNHEGVEKSLLLQEDISESSLKTLVKNQIFESFDVLVPRIDFSDNVIDKEIILSQEQDRAYNEAIQYFEKGDTLLFHGITGSGKTEIYIKFIQQIIEEGGQVLYLLPEIALTTQIIKRLKAYFGDGLGIFHSKYSDNERVEVYNGILSGKYNFIIGVRSAIFLPFTNLSLIIVDEEHETTFKQYDRNPRYHARDAAIVLAKLHHAKIILGTATPSMESYYNAVNEKYGLVTLDTRYGGVETPEINPVDMKDQRKKKLVKGDFSSVLVHDITENLENNEQVILFQNRRGYSPFLTCDDCAHIPKCPNCSVSLTYHMYQNNIRCHYCGYKENTPTHCEVCGSTKIRTVGLGTEKIEEDIKTMFPTARVQRMDLDTTRTKHAYEQIIDDFENGNIDILVGTQMITKGLDFDNVTKVGIMDADAIIHFPDFRSHERAFQLLTQVSGRAGRREKTGKVLLQTNNTNQYVIQKIQYNDFIGFYQKEILERENFKYPPFYRLIRITFKDRDKQVSWEAAKAYTDLIIKELGKHRLDGPTEPVINKIRNQYLNELLIRLEREKINLGKVKELLFAKQQMLESQKQFKGVRIVFDVDPY